MRYGLHATFSGQSYGLFQAEPGNSSRFVGEEWTDTVKLGSGLTITQQSIGVAKNSSGFQGVDGILG